MPFQKGHKKPPNSGRKPGVVNTTTKSAREAFQVAFEAMQKKPGTSLAKWAETNATEFYKLYARLIPVEHTGSDGGPIATTVKHVYETVTAKNP